MATNRENFIKTLLKNRAVLEVEKYDLIKKIWEIDAKIEYINEKLKPYGKLAETFGMGENPADVG